MSMTTSTAVDREAPAYDAFITGVRNAHALELQALQIMHWQIERLENYPELLQALRRHSGETEQQRDRLERILSAYDESPSVLKEGVLAFMGNLAALGHVPAEDEVLKNTFANHAFENYEIAAYDSLLVMAARAGHQDVAGLEQTLAEEERMANEMRRLTKGNTERYLSLHAAGRKASR
jgi:ferritin-like metal-binding protein YciE